MTLLHNNNIHEKESLLASLPSSLFLFLSFFLPSFLPSFLLIKRDLKSWLSDSERRNSLIHSIIQIKLNFIQFRNYSAPKQNKTN